MKRACLLPLFVIWTLLTLASCTLVYPSSPPNQPNPKIDLIQTIVVQTLTAFPYPTVQPSSTPSYTQTTALLPQTPQGFVSFYFSAINSRNYSLTWSLLTDGFKNNMNGPSRDKYQTYADFWNSIDQVILKDVYAVCQGDLCAVNATLQLNYYNGRLNTSTYPYTLTYDHNRNTWMFDFIPVRPPASTRTATATRTQTPTNTRIPTVTKTATPTRSTTPTTTPSSSPTQTGTSTSTETHTATFTPSITATATITETASATPIWTMSMTPSETATASMTLSETLTSTSGP